MKLSDRIILIISNSILYYFIEGFYQKKDDINIIFLLEGDIYNKEEKAEGSF